MNDGRVSRTQRIADNDADFVEPSDMIAELREDNQALTSRLLQVHNVCEGRRDVATASLVEVWIDEAERRSWFLFVPSVRCPETAAEPRGAAQRSEHDRRDPRREERVRDHPGPPEPEHSRHDQHRARE